MRVLLSSTSGAGHFRPLLPYARALARAGHELACAAPVEAKAMVEREGLTHYPFDGVPGDHPDRIAVMSRVPSMPPDEAIVAFGSVIFGRLNTTFALPGARAAVADFQPDLVLHETAESSVWLTAEAAGIPSVAVNPSLTTVEIVRAIASGITELRAGLGLDPDPDGVRILQRPTLSGFPASFDFPHASDFDIRRFREGGDAVDSAGSGDIVYVTLGTESHSLPFFGGLLREVVEGALTAGLPVLVSTGAAIDDGILAGLQGDLQVEFWVDTAEVLARSRVVVCHGGAGSTLAALTAGVPMVVVPLFGDQPDNAARVAATGSGARVDPGPDLSGRVGAAVRALAEQPPSGSSRMAADIAALPPADDAVGWLESLVR